MARKRFDSRPSIRVVTTMPSHPKIVALSDAAFRALVTLWCYCGEHGTDGRLTAAYVHKEVKPKARAELLQQGLMRQFADGYGMHDFVDHNKAADEVEALRQSASERGELGAHLRWHVAMRQPSATCEYCAKEDD